jgi:hypothetical protein
MGDKMRVRDRAKVRHISLGASVARNARAEEDGLGHATEDAIEALMQATQMDVRPFTSLCSAPCMRDL